MRNVFFLQIVLTRNQARFSWKYPRKKLNIEKMKSALQLELEDLHGLAFVSGIIWFALLGVFLIGIAIYLIQKKFKPISTKNLSTPKAQKSEPKGF